MTINENTNCWPSPVYPSHTITTPIAKWSICSYCKGEGVIGCCAGCTCLSNSKQCGICLGSGKVKNNNWNYGYTVRSGTIYGTTATTNTTGFGTDK